MAQKYPPRSTCVSYVAVNYDTVLISETIQIHKITSPNFNHFIQIIFSKFIFFCELSKIKKSPQSELFLRYSSNTFDKPVIMYNIYNYPYFFNLITHFTYYAPHLKITLIFFSMLKKINQKIPFDYYYLDIFLSLHICN
jgi:hypothetical protein